MNKHAGRTLKLGKVEDPLIVFGGPYSNLHATLALTRAAEKFNIPARHIICTGDVVAYCAYPQETVDHVIESGMNVIMGNCEQSLALESGNCGCGFEQDSACDRMSVQWFNYVDTQLANDSRLWMQTLPKFIEFEMQSRTFRVIHGGHENISRFIFPSTPQSVFEEELADSGTDAIIAGHSGIPFTKILGDRLWHNAGVIGMPANDGTSRVWYSTIVPTLRGICIETRELHYDVPKAVSGMRDNGCVEEYAETLVTGRWPSEEVIPVKDRNRDKQPLNPGSLYWG